MSQRFATASYPRKRRTHDDDRFRSFPSATITVPAAVYRRRRCDAHQVVHRMALLLTLASTPGPVARDREGRNAMRPGQREADGFRVDRRQARLTITVTEAADLLGISKTLAYALIRRREIPCIRLGRRVVVPRRALEEMVGSLPSEAHGDKTA